MNKRALLLSGGGSWGAYGGGTLARINGNYNTVIGVSTGSLLAPFVALKEWELLKIGYTSVTENDIFDSFWYKPKPMTKSGKINKLAVIITLILGQNTVCTSKVLKKTIDNFFPKYLFNELQNQHKEVLVGTQNCSQVPSKIHYFSSTNENYEDFKIWMWCSVNFPFFTSLINKSWNDSNGNFHIGQWSDGGISDLIGIDLLMNKGFKEIDIILHRTRLVDRFEGLKINNLMENVTTSFNAMRYDIEFEYFYDRIKRLNKEGTKVTVYWLPRKLSNNAMVFNMNEMSNWWDEGYETAFDSNRIEIFESTNRKLF